MEAYRLSTLYVDSWFPIAYSVLISSLIARLLHGGQKSSRLWRPAAALPFVAAVLDWLENSMHLLLLRNPAELSAVLVTIASTAATAKWWLLAVSAVLVLALTIRIVGQHQGRAVS